MSTPNETFNKTPNKTPNETPNVTSNKTSNVTPEPKKSRKLRRLNPNSRHAERVRLTAQMILTQDMRIRQIAAALGLSRSSVSRDIELIQQLDQELYEKVKTRLREHKEAAPELGGRAVQRLMAERKRMEEAKT